MAARRERRVLGRDGVCWLGASDTEKVGAEWSRVAKPGGACVEVDGEPGGSDGFREGLPEPEVGGNPFTGGSSTGVLEGAVPGHEEEDEEGRG